MGIDYGLGLKNVDLNTGIRYGVISIHEVSQAWSDSSEANYACDTCELKNNDEDFECECDCEVSSFSYEDNEYIAEQLGNDTDIFIIKSPYYTLCNFCSPCAPGAGYIMNQNENGVKAYCFGHDWFDNGKAPYRVFRADNNEEVKS